MIGYEELTPTGDSRPPREPTGRPGRWVSAVTPLGSHPTPPLILTSGTFLDPETYRETVLRKVLMTEGIWRERDLLHTFQKVIACVRGARVDLAWCRCCNGSRMLLLGSCGKRSCYLCRKRYPARKAKKYRWLLGDAPWVGHHVTTMPHGQSADIQPKDANRVLLSVNQALEKVFSPVVPVGFSCLHWSGEEDPEKPHVHVHTIWSGMGLYQGTVVSMPGPKVSREKLRYLREATGQAMRVPPGERQHHYQPRVGERKISHCIRYAVREQGNGDPLSHVKWTFPGVHTLKPLGGLRKSHRKEWLRLRPEHTPEPRDHCTGAIPAQPQDGTHECRCSRRNLVVTHRLD